MTKFNLQPLYRSTFGEIFDMFEDFALSKQESSVPYDVKRLGENDYVISIVVAGFKDQDIEIIRHKDNLAISGTKPAEKPGKCDEYLYKGITEKSFNLNFRLSDNVTVKDINLEDGILTLAVHKDVPEEHKPQKLKINSSPKEHLCNIAKA